MMQRAASRFELFAIRTAQRHHPHARRGHTRLATAVAQKEALSVVPNPLGSRVIRMSVVPCRDSEVARQHRESALACAPSPAVHAALERRLSVQP
jgi:hypothetical protein